MVWGFKATRPGLSNKSMLTYKISTFSRLRDHFRSCIIKKEKKIFESDQINDRKLAFDYHN